MERATDRERFQSLMDLKDFAVKNAYSIPDKLIAEIAIFEHKYFQDAESFKFEADDLGNLDRLTIELSQVTYPITISNLSKVRDGVKISAFVYIVLGVGLIAAFISGWFAWVIKHEGHCAGFAEAVLPLTLGMIGAIVYVMLPNGRLNVVAGLDAENIANNVVRIAMGGLLGYVLYVARFIAQSGTTQPTIDSWTLFLPLIGGYSITLVVGILAKAVAAVQLVFNIDEKSIRASLYK
ncbi:MAG TPA: hypothetical protein VK591_10140 [Xanthobacteraceae bacterium]|nr:hypothetical protein [Xanthobacteraceae bacterium]